MPVQECSHRSRMRVSSLPRVCCLELSLIVLCFCGGVALSLQEARAPPNAGLRAPTLNPHPPLLVKLPASNFQGRAAPQQSFSQVVGLGIKWHKIHNWVILPMYPYTLALDTASFLVGVERIEMGEILLKTLRLCLWDQPVYSKSGDLCWPGLFRIKHLNTFSDLQPEQESEYSKLGPSKKIYET